MIIIIDNYDSFTYNLYQYLGTLDSDIEVHRNDKITLEEIEAKNPSHIVISPGPGYPASAGISINAVRELGKRFPVLGVCLGHQAIGEAFGGTVKRAGHLMHGKTSEIGIDNKCSLFSGMGDRINAARYHSLIVERESLPEELEITAISDEGEIMGLRHKEYPIFGIQFHPESIMTPEGMTILKNFLAIKA
ncbi:MAG: aminodeoxychorismate/anthranilate synthase component II [Clostridiales bacterium]|nr:aminodeoxychorismate/anthranilate synthase component II [Clostridiales bacterium]